VDVQRWDDVPVDWLGPSIGCQLVHTEAMTLARITPRQGR
jgi:hypothetical protein